MYDLAEKNDFDTEWLFADSGIKVVCNVDESIQHISFIAQTTPMEF
jgi:gamma-glutamyl phosphate reductase